MQPIKSVKVVTDSAIEPVTLSEMKDHLRVTSSDEDTLIESLITAARQAAEHYLSRSLISKTYEMTMDDWDTCINIPFPPLLSVESIKYDGTSSDDQTFASSNYTIETRMEPGRIKITGSTPQLKSNTNGRIRIRFKAGYGENISDVPQAIRSAIKIIAATYFEESRQDVISGAPVYRVPMGHRFLLAAYKYYGNVKDPSVR